MCDKNKKGYCSGLYREIRREIKYVLDRMLKQNQTFLDQTRVFIYCGEPDTLIFQQKETQTLEGFIWM